MSVGVLRERHWDNDGDRINILMKCNLDREDYVNLCSPFILPYAWISGRDSCLVGVSCHIPNSGLTYDSFHVSIMFKFKWNLNWGIFKSLKKTSKNNQHLNLIKWVQENVLAILQQYWPEVKCKPIFLEWLKYLFWAFWIKSMTYLSWIYFYYIRNKAQTFL